MVDSSLDFNSHIKQLKTKLVKLVGFLRKIKPFLAVSSLRKLYFAMYNVALTFGLTRHIKRN